MPPFDDDPADLDVFPEDEWTPRELAWAAALIVVGAIVVKTAIRAGLAAAVWITGGRG